MAESAETILARLDERTKHIKTTLDAHIDREVKADIPARVAKLETNVSWLKRLGIGVPAVLSAIAAAYKGMS
jgi:hypothetical protein